MNYRYKNWSQIRKDFGNIPKYLSKLSETVRIHAYKFSFGLFLSITFSVNRNCRGLVVFTNVGSKDLEIDSSFVMSYFQSQINFHGKKLKLGPAIRKHNLCE